MNHFYFAATNFYFDSEVIKYPCNYIRAYPCGIELGYPWFFHKVNMIPNIELMRVFIFVKIQFTFTFCFL